MKDATDVVLYLNRVHALDPEALQALIDTRVPCGGKLLEPEADDCPVVIGGVPGAHTLGTLGLLNGLLDERIAAAYSAPDADGKRKLLGFNLSRAFKEAE